MARLVLVTGGAGFIGSHVCRRLLQAGQRVRVLDDLSTGRRENLPSDVEFVEGSIADPAPCSRACEGVDAVLHLAARVTVRRSLDAFEDDAATNILGTLHVLRAAATARVRRLVLASSMAVYADATAGTLVAEDHPTLPISPYGLAKLTAERYVLLLGPALEVEPVVLRLFNTYGARQGYTPYVGVATIFLTRCLRGETCQVFGDGRQTRDFVAADDVAAAFVQAIDAPGAAGQVINVGSGRGVTINRLAELIGQLVGQGNFEHASAQPGELSYSVADISRAQRLLSYQPQGKLSQGLREVLDDIRQRLAAPR